jgi:KaiC/GvpD/RAD55 family RecA-like ATPase
VCDYVGGFFLPTQHKLGDGIMCDQQCVKTGIHELDIMLGGGLPIGGVVLVRGTPGTGKTTLCAQIMAAFVKDMHDRGADEAVCYLSTD